MHFLLTKQVSDDLTSQKGAVLGKQCAKLVFPTCIRFNFNILKSSQGEVGASVLTRRHTQAQLDTTNNVQQISLALALSEKSCLISFYKYRLCTEKEETERQLSSLRQPTCPNIKPPLPPNVLSSKAQASLVPARDKAPVIILSMFLFRQADDHLL